MMILALFKGVLAIVGGIVFIITLAYHSPRVQGWLTFMNWLNIYHFRVKKGMTTLMYPKDIKIVTEDKEQLGAWLWPHLTETRVTRVVLYFHGNGESRMDPSRMRAYPTIMEKTKSQMLVAFDYRGFGDSTGTPTEEGLTKDALAVLEFASTELKAKEIVFWGQSLGCAVIINLMKTLMTMDDKKKQLELMKYDSDVIILENAFLSIPRLIQHHFSRVPAFLTKRFTDKLVYRFNSEVTLLSKGLPYPTLFLHGEKNSIVPSSHSKILSDIARDNGIVSTHAILSDASHYDVPFSKQATEHIRKFLQQAYGE